MAEKIISALVEGGKATAGPPLGPALGPMGINAGKVVAEINEKTKAFEGTTVPVKVIVDTGTKEYRIEVGTPSVSAMIKKEIELKKGSGKAKEQIVGSITIDQIIKIARAKEGSMLAKTPAAGVKEVIGTCIPMGVLVDEKDPRQVQREVDEGKHDDKIAGKAELVMPTKEQLAEMKEKYKIIEEEKPVGAVEGEKPAEVVEEEKPEKIGKKERKSMKAKAALEKKKDAEAEAAEMAQAAADASSK